MDAEFLIPWLFGSVPYFLVYAGGLWFALHYRKTRLRGSYLAAVGFAVLLAQWMCTMWATWLRYWAGFDDSESVLDAALGLAAWQLIASVLDLVGIVVLAIALFAGRGSETAAEQHVTPNSA
jgi:hypothetical protein